MVTPATWKSSVCIVSAVNRAHLWMKSAERRWGVCCAWGLCSGEKLNPELLHCSCPSERIAQLLTHLCFRPLWISFSFSFFLKILVFFTNLRRFLCGSWDDVSGKKLIYNHNIFVVMSNCSKEKKAFWVKSLSLVSIPCFINKLSFPVIIPLML